MAMETILSKDSKKEELRKVNANFAQVATGITPLSAAQIASPTAPQLADTNATYALNVSPYSRYRSNGTALERIITTTVDAQSNTVVLGAIVPRAATATTLAGTAGYAGEIAVSTDYLRLIQLSGTAGTGTYLPGGQIDAGGNIVFGVGDPTTRIDLSSGGTAASNLILCGAQGFYGPATGLAANGSIIIGDGIYCTYYVNTGIAIGNSAQLVDGSVIINTGSSPVQARNFTVGIGDKTFSVVLLNATTTSATAVSLTSTGVAATGNANKMAVSMFTNGAIAELDLVGKGPLGEIQLYRRQFVLLPTGALSSASTSTVGTDVTAAGMTAATITISSPASGFTDITVTGTAAKTTTWTAYVTLKGF
jgi:hypothetical protein